MSGNPTTLSEKNQGYLQMIQDIYEVSAICLTKTYIWGGYAIDILRGSIVREHGDLDAFTGNMLGVLDALIELYQSRGYTAEYTEAFQILQVRKGELHAGFNGLDVDGDIAMWRHIGKEGTVYFPTHWLDEVPRDFYHVKAYTAGQQFEYAIKTKVAMLNPTWQPREKDLDAIAYLETFLAANGICAEDIYKWIWSYNPFWFKRGYAEFFRPTVAYPLAAK